ncbi:MAG TPA: hypothetical protein PK171_04830, partial [Atribacter sp.]|nr:hypothetical protein [Atribacter sp.]
AFANSPKVIATGMYPIKIGSDAKMPLCNSLECSVLVGTMLFAILGMSIMGTGRKYQYSVIEDFL